MLKPLLFAIALMAFPRIAFSEDLLTIDNGTVKVGIDRDKGASITWLSSKAYPKNIVNLADPGRLIQQSYYAGISRNRQPEGQHKAWSPWPWNPIQGGGVGSWAKASTFEKRNGKLYSETIPKLWDMPNEEALALMRQWTSFEPKMPDTIVVTCEFVSLRSQNDEWGEANHRPQEVPACYFTRNFSTAKSYLGEGKWKAEQQAPGPPWGNAKPPRKAMGFFETEGQGVAVFSPTSNLPWNFGPHGTGNSDVPKAGPCMHVAPIVRARIAPKSTFRYRYWLVLGDEVSISKRLETLWAKYADERATLTQP